MGKHIEKIVFIVCGVCTLLLVLKIGPKVIGFVRLLVEKPTLSYYEMTEREREFLKEESDYQEEDAKRYDEGMLYSSEIKEVKWVRQLYADLEERYPGYQFRITWKTHTGLFGPLGYYVYYLEEEITGREFNAYVYYDNQGDYDYEEDYFYGYFVEEEYAEYIGELLKEKGVEKIVRTGGVMSTVMGKECDSTITVEEIVNGNIDLEKISPVVHIYLIAKGMSEEECKKYSREVQNVLEEINLAGSYGIYCCDMTQEEIISSEREDMVWVYVRHCQSWNWGKEEEE
ncbi:MAG: hypothetical protein HDR13_11155 [Lachnospiraceae bacterium]|nr:hypothetical protein [Lachnospiraceae bacterium]